MVGLVIAAHGHLAEELVATAEQIVGKLPMVATCSIEPGTAPEVFCEQMRQAVASVDSGQGVLVLADLFGGTPCNQGLLLIRDRPLEVVTGVNLPMVLKANSLRSEPMPLPQVAAALASYGQKNITIASAMLREAEPVRNH
jgi:PTS system mannose-specific IIA component